jgi:transposase InsO family protein
MTDNRHYRPIVPNLLAQRFVATTPSRICLTDITSIATEKGRLYLAAVLDSATRRIVDWAKARPRAHQAAARGTYDGSPKAATGPVSSVTRILDRTTQLDSCRAFSDNWRGAADEPHRQWPMTMLRWTVSSTS